MARITDAILGNQAYAAGRQNDILDLTYGGMNGFAPDLTEWVSNAAYVRRHGFFLLLEAPRIFRNLPDSDLWFSSLRSLIELRPKTVEGFNAGIRVETTATPIGGAGMEQEEFTDVKRQNSNPVLTYDDLYGMSIQSFYEQWILMAMADPNSKVPNAATLDTSNRPSDLLPDQYTASAIFIEPDPLHRKVVKSFLCTNMFPKGTGDIVASRDLNSAMQLSNLSIEFTAITMYGLGVNAFAQTLLNNINITNANPYLQPAFLDGISADADTGARGYQSQVENLGATAISRS